MKHLTLFSSFFFETEEHVDLVSSAMNEGCFKLIQLYEWYGEKFFTILMESLE